MRKRVVIGVTDLPDDAYTWVARIRQTLLDDVWRAGTVFAPIIMIGAALRDFHFHGLSWSTVVTSILCVGYVVVFLWRWRLAPDLRAYFPVVFLFVIGVLSTFRNGLQANGLPLLIVVNALVALLFSRRLTLLTFVVTLVVVAAAAVIYITHVLPPRLQPDYATNPQVWILAGATVFGACWVMLRGVAPYRESLQILTERISAQRDAIAALANQDPLTGLPSAGLARDRLDMACRAAARAGERVAVLFIDLDDFKAVNDGFGHLAGDHVLRTVASRLAQSLRKADTAARRGGDELLVVLGGAVTEDAALEVAAKLVATIGQPILFEGAALRVGASIGIAMFPDDGETPEGLMARADAAMYQAKKAGGNRCVVHGRPEAA
jgi:diguanylate cyclase (GGDEF)-like protein